MYKSKLSRLPRFYLVVARLLPFGPFYSGRRYFYGPGLADRNKARARYGSTTVCVSRTTRLGQAWRRRQSGGPPHPRRDGWMARVRRHATSRTCFADTVGAGTYGGIVKRDRSVGRSGHWRAVPKPQPAAGSRVHRSSLATSNGHGVF
jgi:hypothetical protein